jgi:hypothetical protein
LSYSIVPASIRHIKPMAARLRAAACITLQGFGYEPRRALHRVFLNSFYCRTAMVEGRPVAMWGITGTLLNDAAYVWLVMSDDIANIPRSITREAKTELSRIMENYREIATTVLPDDEAAIRFAVYLGFHDNHEGGEHQSRKELERQIRENPKLRIPIGDSYVIGLGYHPAEAH